MVPTSSTFSSISTRSNPRLATPFLYLTHSNLNWDASLCFLKETVLTSGSTSATSGTQSRISCISLWKASHFFTNMVLPTLISRHRMWVSAEAASCASLTSTSLSAFNLPVQQLIGGVARRVGWRPRLARGMGQGSNTTPSMLIYGHVAWCYATSQHATELEGMTSLRDWQCNS